MTQFEPAFLSEMHKESIQTGLRLGNSELDSETINRTISSLIVRSSSGEMEDYAS